MGRDLAGGHTALPWLLSQDAGVENGLQGAVHSNKGKNNGAHPSPAYK